MCMMNIGTLDVNEINDKRFCNKKPKLLKLRHLLRRLTFKTKKSKKDTDSIEESRKESTQLSFTQSLKLKIKNFGHRKKNQLTNIDIIGDDQKDVRNEIKNGIENDKKDVRNEIKNGIENDKKDVRKEIKNDIENDKNNFKEKINKNLEIIYFNGPFSAEKKRFDNEEKVSFVVTENVSKNLIKLEKFEMKEFKIETVNITEEKRQIAKTAENNFFETNEKEHWKIELEKKLKKINKYVRYESFSCGSNSSFSN
ncbi:hypothetical protein MHBO_001656 [Bonamia ostreae]|uniref:Uncharacterized protein n=1 Tax=Bonamia ostreae TaxID=126728 RepID=A0ABV2AJQ4_9EUKA